MKIKEFLSPSDVMIDVRATDKVGLLKELAARAASALDLPVDVVANDIEKRDELGRRELAAASRSRTRAFVEVNKPFGS